MSKKISDLIIILRPTKLGRERGERRGRKKKREGCLEL